MARKDIDRARLQCLTPEARVTFVHVFEPHRFEEGDDPQYQMVMVFDSEADLSELEAAVAYAAELINPKWEQLHARGKFNLPFRKCEEYEDNGEPFTDDLEATFIRVSSKDKFPIVDENVDDIINKREFYSGCYARAAVYAHGYSNKNTGVTLFCNGAQKTRDGEPLSGGGVIDPKKVFAPIGGKKKLLGISKKPNGGIEKPAKGLIGAKSGLAKPKKRLISTDDLLS